MKLPGPQIISELRDKLRFDVGRHLYAILGTYAQLRRFEDGDLAHAVDFAQHLFPTPINLNQSLLQRIPDDELRNLVRDEARFPQSVRGNLNRAVQAVLQQELQAKNLLIIKQLEMLFAYNLDLTIFRTSATNQKHILLLIPGERRGQHVALFQDADQRFHHTLPDNLIADNHMWELSNG